MSSAPIKKLPASPRVSLSGISVANRSSEKVNVAFSNFGAGSGDGVAKFKRMNSCIPACFNSLGFRLLFERGIQVSVMRRFVGCILEEILLFPVARTGLLRGILLFNGDFFGQI
jgi:hypothetical protein